MPVIIKYEKDGKVFTSEGLNKTIRELGYNGPNKNNKDAIRWMESVGCKNIEVDGSEYQASPSATKKSMSPLEVIIKQYLKYNSTEFEKTKKERLEALKVKREATIEKMITSVDIVDLKNAKNELLGVNFEIEEVKNSVFETNAESVLKWVKKLFDEQALAQAPQDQAPQEKEKK